MADMVPSGMQEWVLLLLGLLAGYFIVKHFCATGSAV